MGSENNKKIDEQISKISSDGSLSEMSEEEVVSSVDDKNEVFDEESDSDETRFLGERTKSKLLAELVDETPKAPVSVGWTVTSPRALREENEAKKEESTKDTSSEEEESPRAPEEEAASKEEEKVEADNSASPVDTPAPSSEEKSNSATETSAGGNEEKKKKPRPESSLRMRLRQAHAEAGAAKREPVSINLESLSALAVADIKRFSMSSTAVVEVEVSKAKGLHPVKAGPPSAMCLLAIRKDTSKDHERKIDTKKPHETTSVIPRNSAPCWNEKKELKLDQVKGESQRYLVVEIRDKGPKGDLLGFVEINLNNIADLIQREEWFDLQKKKKKDKVTGEILIRTRIRPERKVEETIVMRGESFPTIPSFIYNSFWNQHCVRQLSVTHCDIGSIPEGISALSSLEMLQVSNNNISVVPKTLGRIFTLKMLDISHNRITKLPQEIANLKNLQFFHITDNKWSDDTVPPPVVDLDLWCDIIGKPDTWNSLIEEELRRRESEQEEHGLDASVLEKEKEIQRLLESMNK